MTLLLVLLFSFLASANGLDTCITPDGRYGECVLLNHCPHFLAVLQNRSKIVSEDHVRQSHCGFESIWFPKVCCPMGSVARHAPRCGMHTPEGEQDPWIALIGYEKRDGSKAFVCGGVLIHKRYVLTAAHCVKRNNIMANLKVVIVRFGDQNSNRPSDVQVDDIVTHENYNEENHQNDVALIRLKKKVYFVNGEIRPICLQNGEKTVEGNFQLAGWGKSGNESDNFAKRAGLATVWKTEECHSWYNNTEFRLGESQICAEGKIQPYLHKHNVTMGGILTDVNKDNSYSLVGISSLKPSCCRGEEHPQVYTKVGKYVNWIFNNFDI